MISMFTDFKLWDMGGSVTNILSVIKNNFCYVVFDKTRFVYYPNGRYAPYYRHTTVAMMLSSNCL